MARGRLRIYLGAAPGVGKTYAMLGEGVRRHERGTDVVIGLVETHGRARTAEQVGDLPVIPRRALEYRGVRLEEMDLDAVLARRPEVALIDELAHTNAPGSRNTKRWQDVEELLEAGIDVISTLNIQHLESLNDVVEQIVGVRQAETIPDAIARRADQIELVDMVPEALRRRLAHGNVYPPERVDTALANFFRVGNLGALRELALLWVADKVDDELDDYRRAHGIAQPWETRERIVVALAGRPDGDRLIRRGARIAARTHGDLVGVHVQPRDELSTGSAGLLDAQRRLVRDLGGTVREVTGEDVGEALIEAARALNATQIVLGATRRSRWTELTQGSVINRVLRDPGLEVDVHVIGHREGTGDEVGDEDQGRRRLLRRRRPRAVPPRRLALGVGLAAAGAPLLTLALTQARDEIGLSSVLLVYLLLVVAIAAVGGMWPALLAAVGCFLLANWYFVTPLHTLTIRGPDNVVALLAFIAVAATVSALVSLAARRAAEGARLRDEAATLEALAGSPSVSDLLERLRRALGVEVATLWHRDEGAWRAGATSGEGVAARDAEGAQPVDGAHVLAIEGGSVTADDRHLLEWFVAELAAAVHLEELEQEAQAAGGPAAASELRAALLSAVSHDLRAPLAAIRASVTSVLGEDGEPTPGERRELLSTIDASADRLDGLAVNLLDMSRLQTGALRPAVAPLGLQEVVPAAVRSLGDRGRDLAVEIPEGLPRVLADAGLLERALASLLASASAKSPEGCPARVLAGSNDGWVDLRVVDRGHAIPADAHNRVVEPSPRLAHPPPGDGAGLGLGVELARGFLDAMGGSVELEDTPGGGLTVVLRLKAAP